MCLIAGAEVSVGWSAQTRLNPMTLLMLMLIALLALNGCSTVPASGPPPPLDSENAGAPAVSDPPARLPLGQPQAGRETRPLFVVVDDARRVELEILRVFSARLGRPYRIFNLAYRSPDSVRRELTTAAPADVIALGAAAYALAGEVGGLHMVHAGVFESEGAAASVDALPSVDVQLDYWLRMSPGIAQLGVIGSAAVISRMQRLEGACTDRGVSLESHVVTSDREALLAFRSMVPRIDGFVLLPDRKVLSPAVIQQIITHARHNSIQTLVYSPAMFNLGATLYVQPDPVRVAEALIEQMRDSGPVIEVSAMRVRSRTGGVLAQATVAAENLVGDGSERIAASAEY